MTLRSEYFPSREQTSVGVLYKEIRLFCWPFVLFKEIRFCFSEWKTLVKEDNKPLTQISCKNSSESPVKPRMGPLDCSRVGDMLQLSNDSIQQRATLPGFVQLNVLFISNTLLFNWIKEFQRTTFLTTFQLGCEIWKKLKITALKSTKTAQ